jgi:anti-sigma-K factor RskA
MERTGIHELSAAYALDALDGDERREFEEHLTHCAECRLDVASFQEAASALAYQVEVAPSATGLERPHPRAGTARTLECGSAQTSVGARGRYGRCRCSLRSDRPGDLGGHPAQRIGQASEAVPLTGASGSVIVTPGNEATLVVEDLAPAPAGKTYEAWVIQDDKPVRAGTFGGGGQMAFPLTRKVPEGAIVAVTLQQAGGVDRPTTDPVFASEPV